MGAPAAARRHSLPTLIDLEEAAHHLGTTTRHLRRLIAERRIPYVKIGHLIRFDPRELEGWLEGHTFRPVAPGRRDR